MSLNRVAIAGRMARDLELRYTQSGIAVASFTLAVEGDLKDKQTGEKPVYWVDCVAWSHTAEFMSRYLREKGRAVVLDGRLQTRAWQDRDGNKRKSVEVVADSVYFGDSKQAAEGRNAPDQSYSSYSARPAQGFQEITDEDDGALPF